MHLGSLYLNVLLIPTFIIYRSHRTQIFLLCIQQFLDFILGVILLLVSRIYYRTRFCDMQYRQLLVKSSFKSFHHYFQVHGLSKHCVMFCKEIELAVTEDTVIFSLASLVLLGKSPSISNLILLEIM